MSEVDGTLSAILAFRAITDEQHRAWLWTAEEVHRWASATEDGSDHWLVLLEYSPPLVTARPDILIVTDDTVVVGEVKTGHTASPAGARKQAHGYAEDLYWFHPGCRGRSLIPVVLSERGESRSHATPQPDEVPRLDDVQELNAAGVQHLLGLLSLHKARDEPLDEQTWLHAGYRPRPSIVDAAVALVAANDDPGVNAALTGDDELERLTELLVDQVHQAATAKDHRLLIVSGVPGAGKTLVGLRLAHDPGVVERLRDLDSVPLYLTGNGPLVAVLTEALARDFNRRNGTTMADARRQAGVLVKLVHSFTRSGLDGADDLDVPHVAVFDEGQRVWNSQQMRNKHVLREDDDLSEPDVILRRLEAREWAVVVALVGEGQEINTGETGAGLWLEAIEKRASAGRRRWIGLAPDHLVPSTATDLTVNDGLYLKRTRRSVGAAWMSDWVSAVLEGRPAVATPLPTKAAAGDDPYPLLITRDLEGARSWLRAKSGRARSGLVASARAARLRAYGLEMSPDFQAAIKWPHWFLDRPPSLSSSSALEVAASEFKCQGLELDFVCLAWCWDLIRSEESWQVRQLQARKLSWRLARGEKRRFGLNAYRVLMTRARAGLVIWVPEGVASDPTRDPGEMDAVARFLRSCGMSPIDSQ